jgi:uncharacterized protein YciI
MFVVFLRFSSNKAQAAQHMPAHNAWVQRGFDEGVFLVVGSLQPNEGGAIIAHGLARSALDARLQEDPFVQHGVVSAEVFEVKPTRIDPRLGTQR